MQPGQQAQPGQQPQQAAAAQQRQPGQQAQPGQAQPGQQAAVQPQAQQPATAQQQQRQERLAITEDQRRGVRDRLGVGATDPQATGAVGAQPLAQTRPLSFSEVQRMNVHNFRGERLGSVHEIVLDPRTNQHYVIVASGGFLGFGEDRVAFPMDRFWIRGDQLYLRGVTEEDIDAMDDYRDQNRGWRRTAGNERGNFRVWQ